MKSVNQEVESLFYMADLVMATQEITQMIRKGHEGKSLVFLSVPPFYSSIILADPEEQKPLNPGNLGLHEPTLQLLPVLLQPTLLPALTPGRRIPVADGRIGQLLIRAEFGDRAPEIGVVR